MKATITITPINIRGTDIQAVKVTYAVPGNNSLINPSEFYAAGRSSIQREVGYTAAWLRSNGVTQVTTIDNRSKT